MGALVQPLLFWLLLGAGFQASLRPPGAAVDLNALEYFYPGIIALVLLFTAIFSTISVVEDRKAGFLQGVLVAPVPRARVVLGQALGGTTLATAQGALFLAFAPFLGIRLAPLAVLASLGVLAAVAFALTSLGLVIAWRMESTQGFHAIMNMILMPIWLLSGAFFPIAGAAGWLEWIMHLNPLTYGVAALRHCLYLGTPVVVGPAPSLPLALAVTLAFCGLTYVGATVVARRSG